ncbi:E3 ubiquitin-protein ligase ARIH2-like [Protopterus annectens]|uniref:E3 ubiquitin-protein ligase ARIH2-like n=1 Tax=Protopterus annectens TaxID=7888 RepID=UPI001CFB84E5|nr:E3 ubiquitin-protein ligase ARIH2-like [Protopterus annectens]
MSDISDSKKCPGCNTPTERSCAPNLCQPCYICSVKKRIVYQFCWSCLQEWKGPSPKSDCCSNKDCMIRGALLSGNIDTPGSSVKGCPRFRVCPGCNALLTHTNNGCRNIHCPACGRSMCYRCLADPSCKNCTIQDNSSTLKRLGQS